MKKNNTFLILMAMTASFFHVNAQKYHSLSLGLGKTYASDENYSYSRVLLIPTGEVVSDAPDRSASLGGWNIKLGYERQFNRWFSLGANMAGFGKKDSGTELLAERTPSGQNVNADFPYRSEHRTGVFNVQAIFNVLKSNKFELKLGFGPTFYRQRHSYISQITLIYEDNSNSRFYEQTDKTTNSSDTGASYLVGFNMALFKSLALQSQFSLYQYNDFQVVMFNLGVGWRLGVVEEVK